MRGPVGLTDRPRRVGLAVSWPVSVRPRTLFTVRLARGPHKWQTDRLLGADRLKLAESAVSPSSRKRPLWTRPLRAMVTRRPSPLPPMPRRPSVPIRRLTAPSLRRKFSAFAYSSILGAGIGHTTTSPYESVRPSQFFISL